MKKKCYSFFDRDDPSNAKFATKGISKGHSFLHEQFLECLYQNRGLQVSQTSLRFDRERGMTTKSELKNGLNHIYTKQTVDNDCSTLYPLMKNNILL